MITKLEGKNSSKQSKTTVETETVKDTPKETKGADETKKQEDEK